MMKRFALFSLIGILLTSMGVAAPLLGTKNPFYESVFCKFYLCDLIERKMLTSSIEQFEYAVTPNESDYHSSIKSVCVTRDNGVLIGGGMSMGVQDDFFASSGQNGFVQRFIESLTGVRVNDDQLGQLQRLANQNVSEAGRTGKPMSESSIRVGSVGQKMSLFFRLVPRGSYWDAQFRVSL